MNQLPDDVLQGFLAWHSNAKARGLFSQGEAISVYTMLKEAFLAGTMYQPLPQRQPSRDALDDKRREIMRRYAPPQPYAGPREGRLQVQFPPERQQARVWPDPAPDYVQHGTVTGRIPPFDPATESGYPMRMPSFTPAGPAGGLDYREPGRHPLAGPSEETLRRVHDGLTRNLDPAPAPMMHTETVWMGPDPHREAQRHVETQIMPALVDEDDNYGPPGPVLTATGVLEPLPGAPEYEGPPDDMATDV